MPHGSIWRRWDFHLHTPYSVLNNQFGDPAAKETWERFVSSIEQKAAELEIAAIGVTDYFTIDGYKRLKEFQTEGRLKGIMLFPNIEFRIDKLIYRDQSGSNPKRINIHVLFDPSVPINIIEEHFLYDLSFVHEGNTFEPATTRKLKKSNLEEFGESLRQQHSKFQEYSALYTGCMNAVVGIENVKAQLEDDPRFRGRYLIVLADENLSSISWDGQDHGIRKQLLQMSHAIFSSNESTRNFCIGASHESEKAFTDEFKSLKPCIWGCDSHGYEQRFLEPDQKRFCWIKSEVSWEGLKQILYEPHARVRIQQDSPEPNKSIYTLNSAYIAKSQVNDSLCISEVNIKLNSNLIAIIGGRGSGKTALLDLLANCFAEGQKLKDIDSSFYHRLYAKKGSSSNPVPICISFKSGEEFPEGAGTTKNVGQDDLVFDSSDILYLTQNHIDDYTSNPYKLYEHIIDLLFENRADQRRKYQSIIETIDDIQRKIESNNLEVQQLQKQVKGKALAAQTERTQRSGELTDSKNRLKEFEEQQAGSTDKSYTLTDQLVSAKQHRDQMVELKSCLTILLDYLEQFHIKYKVDAQAINIQFAQLKNDLISESIPEKLTDVEKAVELIASATKILVEAKPTTDDHINEIETQLGQLQGIDHILATHRQKIDDITNAIQIIDDQIVDLQAKEKQIQNFEKDRISLYARLLNVTTEQRIYLQSVIGQFKIEQNELLHGLSFAAKVDTSNRSGYIANVVEKVDGRAHSAISIKEQLLPIVNEIHDILNNTESLNDDDIPKAFASKGKQLYDVAEKFNLKGSTSQSDYYNTVFSPFFQIGLHIEFSNRPLEALSMGERAVVLLKILLGLDDKPLLIDQPEEHLDNRYIYDELTPAFRAAKQRRQIIIATHNANLVVNTDAEQIIVAEHQDGVLSYTSGTLENPEICERIKTILEGGDEAFKKREERYGFRF